MLSTKTRKLRHASYLGSVVDPASPENTELPTISGDPVEGGTLIATPGTWTGEPEPNPTIQWLADGVDIPGARGTTYVPTEAVVGKKISVKEVGSTVAGRASVKSAETAAVTGAVAPANTVAPAITGTAQVGQTLTASNGTWTGSPIPTIWRQWLADGEEIEGEIGATYDPVEGDIGKAISLRVTGTNVRGSVTVETAETDAVIAAD